MAATRQEQLDAINDAILKVSSGVRRYRNANGEEVEYASLPDLLKVRAELEVQQQAEGGNGIYVPIEFGRAS